ncbi:TPA: hypothetical protein QFT03_001362 [Kluyvera ascorbata]|nr:hypothetical protein [Kluyvera ascorbata]
MALPWLIGAAVLGIGAIIASSGDDSSSNNNGDDEERRRRERAERERREREINEQRQTIKETLLNEGEKRSADFQQLLSGCFNAEYQSQPPFKAKILETGTQYKRIIAEYYTDAQQLSLLYEKTRENLNEFEACYDVKLSMTADLSEKVNAYAQGQRQLDELQQYRSKLEARLQKLKS